MGNKEAKEYYKRLRSVVLQSAGEHPGRVERLLSDLLRSRSRDRRKEVYENYFELAKEHPDALAKFVREDLIDEEWDADDRHHVSAKDQLGIGRSIDQTFSPPVHVQGPFLRLLREHEEVGLSLIHKITNTALDRKSELLQNPYRGGGRRRAPTYTFAPITINLPDGSSEYYGDEEVYYWFRSAAKGPDPVICALMALEYWVEQQIEEGRTPSELFARVLEGSQCIAVPGLCLGVAMAFPGKCLEAALPFVSVSSIWRLDIKRYASDQMSPSGQLGFNAHQRIMHRLQAKRDDRPQRSVDIRRYGMRYMLVGGDLRERFREKVSAFGENPPYVYEEERKNEERKKTLQEDARKYALIADPERYEFEQAESGILISVEPPEDIRREEESTQEMIREEAKAHELLLWVQRAYEEESIPDTLSVSEALDRAEGQLQEIDLGGLEEYESTIHLPGAIGALAASLTFAFDEVGRIGKVEWCCDLLRNVPIDSGSPLSTGEYSPQYYAAHGLCAVLVQGVEEKEIKLKILELIAKGENVIVGAVSEWTARFWRSDRGLFWCCVSLGLTCSNEPLRRRRSLKVSDNFNERKEAYIDEALTSHEEQLSDSDLPDYPDEGYVKEGHRFRSGRCAELLSGLPLKEMTAEGESATFLRRLTDELMEWTIENNPSGHSTYRAEQPPMEWNRSFLNWVAHLNKHLPKQDGYEHVISPVFEVWPNVANLGVELLDGYIHHGIATHEEPQEKVIEQWKWMSDRVVTELEAKSFGHRRGLPRELKEAASLVVFCRYGRCLIKETWQHAGIFEDIISSWVTATAFRPETYTDLILLMKGPGYCFLPVPGLKWIEEAATESELAVWTERENGRRTAELLNQLWEEQGSDMSEDQIQLLSTLVDELVSTGVPPASLLREKLEGRK